LVSDSGPSPCDDSVAEKEAEIAADSY